MNANDFVIPQPGQGRPVVILKGQKDWAVVMFSKLKR